MILKHKFDIPDNDTLKYTLAFIYDIHKKKVIIHQYSDSDASKRERDVADTILDEYPQQNKREEQLSGGGLMKMVKDLLIFLLTITVGAFVAWLTQGMGSGAAVVTTSSKTRNSNRDRDRDRNSQK